MVGVQRTRRTQPFQHAKYPRSSFVSTPIAFISIEINFAQQSNVSAPPGISFKSGKRITNRRITEGKGPPNCDYNLERRRVVAPVQTAIRTQEELN